MFRVNLLSVVTAAVFAISVFAVTSQSQACDPPCVYKTICIYETRVVPYAAYVTKYDHCGKAYQVSVARYKSISVPVHKVVKVCH